VRASPLRLSGDLLFSHTGTATDWHGRAGCTTRQLTLDSQHP